MSRRTRCPAAACRREVVVADACLGPALRCPHCGTAFPNEGPSPAITRTLPPDGPPAATPTLPVGTGPSATLRESLPPGAAPASPEPGLERIGRFEVRARLGEGAFGVVYRAYDPRLDREVALKVAKPGTLNTTARVQRFLREAKAAAQLRHPTIVPVYDSGEDGQQYYIASAYIPGHSLADALQGLPEGTGMAPRRAAALVRPLAEALAYAHKKGVIHRDVKPANVMLDEQGEPLLLDFGLAARAEGDAKLTHEGVVLGTPAYLAPEQANGQAEAASDQYSLGCTLYELLTGRTPFSGPPAVQVMLHQTQEPPAPRALNRQVPRDLETICLKCLAKRPAERYRNCQALADDLRRYLDGEAIAARRQRLAERAWRWVKKEPRLAGALTAAALLLLTTAVVMAVSAEQQRKLTDDLKSEVKARGEANTQTQKALDDLRRETKAKDEANARRAEEVAARERQYRMSLYGKDFREAQAAWAAHDLVRARRLLNSLPADLRGWEWDYLERQCQRKAVECRGHTAGVNGVAFSPDGKRLVSGGSDQVVTIWDAASGKVIRALEGHSAGVNSVAFSPDGKRIASGSGGVGLRGEVKVWDAASGKEMITLPGHAGWVFSVAFSPDGRRIASGSGDAPWHKPGEVKVWEVATGKEALSCRGHSDWVRSVAFRPDGRRIASGSEDRTVKVWDAATGAEILTLKGHSGGVRSVAFSPDGQRVVSGSEDRTVKVWDAATGQEMKTLDGHTGWVLSVAFSPDGRHVASGGGDRTVKVWDAATGKEVLSLQGHASEVLGVAFSPDSKRIVSGSGSADRSQPGEVKVWDAAAGQETNTLQGHTGWVFSAVCSPDGKSMASGGADQTAKVWDAATGQVSCSLQGHRGSVFSVAFRRDGQRIVSGSGDRTVKVWDAATGKEVLSLQGHPSEVFSVAFSPDGRRLVSGGGDQSIRVWDAATGQEILSLQGHTNSVLGVAFSPDGRRLVSGSKDGTVRVWDTATGE